MGLIPMTPARCGLNSSPSQTDARCNLPQFANSPRGISSVLPCYCIGFHVLPWKEPTTLLLVVLVPRLGGLGHEFLSISWLLKDAASCSQGRLRPTLKPPRCGAARALGVVETLFSTASGPVSRVLLPSQWGSTLLLVRALAPYSTLLL